MSQLQDKNLGASSLFEERHQDQGMRQRTERRKPVYGVLVSELPLIAPEAHPGTLLGEDWQRAWSYPTRGEGGGLCPPLRPDFRPLVKVSARWRRPWACVDRYPQHLLWCPPSENASPALTVALNISNSFLQRKQARPQVGEGSRGAR